MDNTARTLSYIQAKPILKWAGGKTQMLNDLLPKVPSSYGRYIEPFFGGGALFFALRPENAIIADSNPELVNMYRQVANNLDDVIDYLKKYKNTSEMFYQVRALEWTELPPAEAAARTIYLNRTCFNGLYRVNRKGQFNVPYGKYVNPKICDEENLHAVSKALQKAEIVCGDYLLVLEHYAKPGDFIFLDPPYLPISEYSDFKRYTKEQFYEEDHVELAKMVMRLHEMGCSVVLTNSNHPLVHELYSPFKIDVIQTKRHISCNGKSRKGEDVIVTVPPKHKTLMKLAPQPLPQQVSCYPPTRFMGSKSKLLSQIWAIASQFEFETAVDLFSGSGIVGYMFKAQGKSVISNDYMAMSATFTNGKLLPNMERMEPFNVIYQTAEDGLGDTVKPRLIEAGADLDRVLVIDDSEVQLTLSDERIEKAIIENNARLVIIDPIQAYLGADVDMNRANEVRPIFMRLGQVAQRTGCAILLIGHLNKAAGMQSLQRGLGSIDIAAAVRSVMFIGKLKHDPTMRILTHEKSSLAPPGASLAFSLGDEGGFRWVGEYDITADEMLSGIEPQRETKTQQAKDLICTLLAGGKQVLSEDIDKAALERGIPGRTVRDAKRELGDALKSKIVEGRKKVFWME